jgi:hypothetical protein
MISLSMSFLIELSYLDVTTPLKHCLFTFKYRILVCLDGRSRGDDMGFSSLVVGHVCPLKQHKWIMI